MSSNAFPTPLSAPSNCPAQEGGSAQAQALISQFVVFDSSGGLAEHVRKVVANNAAL